MNLPTLSLCLCKHILHDNISWIMKWIRKVMKIGGSLRQAISLTKTTKNQPLAGNFFGLGKPSVVCVLKFYIPVL